MTQTTPTIVTEMPELTPEIKEVYGIWDAANDLIKEQTEVIAYGHYESFHIGNLPRSVPDTTLKKIVVPAHGGIRSLMENIGGLFQPKLAPAPVGKIYDVLRSMRTDYKKEPATVKKAYEKAFGPNSAKPMMVTLADLPAARNEKRYFKNTEDLITQLATKKIAADDVLKYEEAYYQSIRINKKIDEKLQVFAKALHQLPYIILGQSNEAQLQLDDHIISFNDGKPSASFAYMLFGLNQMSKHDIDDTVAPEAFAKTGRHYFGQSAYILPNLKKYLSEKKLYTQPLIVSKFQDEAILLTENIAHAVGDYRTLITDCPPKEEKFKMIAMLGLYNEKLFETAKENYLARESAKAEKPKPERKKPVMSCPFGFKAP